MPKMPQSLQIPTQQEQVGLQSCSTVSKNKRLSISECYEQCTIIRPKASYALKEQKGTSNKARPRTHSVKKGKLNNYRFLLINFLVIKVFIQRLTSPYNQRALLL